MIEKVRAATKKFVAFVADSIPSEPWGSQIHLLSGTIDLPSNAPGYISDGKLLVLARFMHVFSLGIAGRDESVPAISPLLAVDGVVDKSNPVTPEMLIEYRDQMVNVLNSISQEQMVKLANFVNFYAHASYCANEAGAESVANSKSAE